MKEENRLYIIITIIIAISFCYMITLTTSCEKKAYEQHHKDGLIYNGTSWENLKGDK